MQFNVTNGKVSTLRWELRHVKIIAISAYSLTENDERITAAGCDGFIPKPIDTRALAFSIRKYLDGDSTPS